MLMPRPVPSIVRFRFSSIRSKGAKSFFMSSFLMPMPVSFTLTCSFTWCSSSFSGVTDSVTDPVSVYLTALVRMFVTTCLMRISSPIITCGSSCPALTISCRPLSDARFRIMLIRSFSTDAGSYSTGMISILPASILEKSRMSLTMPSRLPPALRRSSAYRMMPSSVDSRRIISSMPRIALIGVRISCDILDRKRDFARFAASACSAICR